jgi:hypothetical protein
MPTKKRKRTSETQGTRLALSALRVVSEWLSTQFKNQQIITKCIANSSAVEEIVIAGLLRLTGRRENIKFDRFFCGLPSDSEDDDIIIYKDTPLYTKLNLCDPTRLDQLMKAKGYSIHGFALDRYGDIDFEIYENWPSVEAHWVTSAMQAVSRLTNHSTGLLLGKQKRLLDIFSRAFSVDHELLSTILLSLSESALPIYISLSAYFNTSVVDFKIVGELIAAHGYSVEYFPFPSSVLFDESHIIYFITVTAAAGRCTSPNS